MAVPRGKSPYIDYRVPVTFRYKQAIDTTGTLALVKVDDYAG